MCVGIVKIGKEKCITLNFEKYSECLDLMLNNINKQLYVDNQ